MGVLLRAIGGVYDLTSWAPSPVPTLAIAAFLLALLASWSFVSTRFPHAGVGLNLAILAVSVVDAVAVWRAPPPLDPLPFESFGRTLSYGADAVIAVFGLAGIALAVASWRRQRGSRK
jgi:membrane-bound metal-dependent hydrolase YbcI (DUF457 family)